MRDKSGAHRVAPDGSRLGIMPTTSGGIATLPRAPGHERPSGTSSGVPGHDRPRATPRAPDRDVPRTFTARAPGSDRPSAAPCVPVSDRFRPVQKAPGHGRPSGTLSGVSGHDRPRATPRAPGADVPPATTARAPGQHRLSAVPSAPVPNRSRPVQRAPGHGRPAASSDAVRHDRLRAILRAPDQDIPRTLAVQAPGSERPCAVAATAAAPDGPRVSHPVAGPDSSHRGPAAGPRLTSLTHPTAPAHDLHSRAYTTQEVQQLAQADLTPLLASEAHLLQDHTQQNAALGIPRSGGCTNVGRASDALQPLRGKRQARAPASEDAPFRLLDEAARRFPTAHLTRKEHHPMTCRCLSP